MGENFAKIFPDERHNNEHETILRQSQLVMLRILKIVDYICKKHHINYWLEGGTLLGAIRHKGFIPWDDDLDIAMMREDYEKFIKVAKDELPEDLFLQSNETDVGYDMPWIKIRDNNSRINEYKTGNYNRGIFIDIFPVDSYGEKYTASLKCKKIYKALYRGLILIKEPFEEVKNKKIIIKNIIKFVSKVVFFPFALMKKETTFLILKYIGERLRKRYADINGSHLGYGIEILFWNILVKKQQVFPLITVQFEDGEFSAPNNCHEYLTTLFGDYMKLPPEKDRVNHNQGLQPILKAENNIKMTL